MNKLDANLATTTLLFAGTTFYFWQKLESRDVTIATVQDRSEAATAAKSNRPPSAASSASTSMVPAGKTGTTVDSSTVAAAVSSAKGGSAADASREMMLPFAKDFLRQYDDPSQRATLIKAARAGVESQYSRLKGRLKLDSATFGQLVDLIVEEQLEQQANYDRCVVNPACDTSKVITQPRDRSSEYLAMLGTDGYAQFTAFRSALPEWQSVVQLRGRLAEENSLKDGDAERLLSALSAERERYVTETNQAGANLRAWGNGTGMIWYSGSGGVEEQLASAEQYSERMRQRAASILTGEQLRAFVQLQEEMLANLTSYLRSQSGRPG